MDSNKSFKSTSNHSTTNIFQALPISMLRIPESQATSNGGAK